MKDSASIITLLDDKDPDFELTYFGEAGQVGVFTIYRRADGMIVGQLRTGHRFCRFIRFDLPHTVPSPNPFWTGVGLDDDDERGYAPAWDTRAGFAESFEKYPFTSGRW